MHPSLAKAFYFILLLTGIFACSTSVIMIKTSAVHPTTLAAWRLILAAVFLSPLFIWAWRREPEHFGWRDLKPSVLPAVLLALHFISWAAGARMTWAANATLIVNMVPIVMPFFLFFLIRERVNRPEIIGTLLALAGVVVLTMGDYRIAPGNLLGDFVCFASMLLFGLYLAYGRLNRSIKSLWLYMVPLYAIAGVICLILSIPFANPLVLPSANEIGWLIALALIPTVLGHSLLNFSLKHISGQAVSVCNLGQFVFAGIMAFFIFGETPHLPFYPAVLLVLAGAVTVVLAMPPTAPTPVRVLGPQMTQAADLKKGT
jgi:drug/metabolite transporter (DMT)-like permease